MTVALYLSCNSDFHGNPEVVCDEDHEEDDCPGEEWIRDVGEDCWKRGERNHSVCKWNREMLTYHACLFPFYCFYW